MATQEENTPKQDDFFEENTPKQDDFFDEPPKQNVHTPEPPKENGEIKSEEEVQINGEVTEADGNADCANDPPQRENDVDEEAEVKDDGEVNGSEDGQATSVVETFGGNAGKEAVPEETVDGNDPVEPSEDGLHAAGDGAQDNQAEVHQGEDAVPAAETEEQSQTQPDHPEPEATEEATTPRPAEEDENTQEKEIVPLSEGEGGERKSPAGDDGDDVSQIPLTEGGERKSPAGGDDDVSQIIPMPEEEGEKRKSPAGEDEDAGQIPVMEEGDAKGNKHEDSYNDAWTENSEKLSEHEQSVAGGAEDGPGKAGEEEQEKKDETKTEDQLAETASLSDSRAEAGSVVPVIIEQETNDIDRRSNDTVPEDQGEFNRGEDRTEELAPEGSENCRGEGQWKTEEQQYLASAIMVQKNDREAMEEAVHEKEKLYAEYSDVKAKDLQERIAILARENEHKDKRIVKLEDDLRDVTDKLRETERKLFASELSNTQNQEAATKSKTCVIM